MAWTFRPLAALCAGLCLAAGSAHGQTPVEDPIGALLDNPPPLPASPNPAQDETPIVTAPTAPQPAAPPAAASAQAPTPVRPAPVVRRPPVSPPITPSPPPLPARTDRDRPTIATQPVFLDAPDPLGAPLNDEERNYEARLRASFESAQGLQGPLDGGWALAAASGGDLYALRFVDRGSGDLEAAWRDLRRPGALDGSGFVDHVERLGGRVTLRFSPRRGAPPTVITLSAGGDGQWSGELVEGGAPRGVVMRRR